jgi:DNA-binding HxlR family transcriptional regulator
VRSFVFSVFGERLCSTGLPSTVTRTAYPEVPPRVEYALTGLCATLLDPVTALIDWAGTHHDENTANCARLDGEAAIG